MTSKQLSDMVGSLNPGIAKHVLDFLSSLASGQKTSNGRLTKLKAQDYHAAADAVLQLLEPNEAHNRQAYRNYAWSFLDIIRARQTQRTLVLDDSVKIWFEKILAIIERSNLTIGKLFLHRVNTYQNQILFQTLRDGEITNYTWLQVWQRVLFIARALHQLRQTSRGNLRIALFTENRMEMACLDLACLFTGIVNVPIAANSTAGSLEFIFEHSGCTTLFISGSKRYQEFKKIARNLTKLEHLFTLDVLLKDLGPDAKDFAEFLNLGVQVTESQVLQAINEVSLDDLATIMYTSGTTEVPKGIMFSQLNLISKRFARALALPEIGDTDKFICFLPLFHTFGRFFEMLGCIFWGATYVFLENVRIETIIRTMQLTRPTVFISIPKKWIQLYQQIQESVDIHQAPDQDIKAMVRKKTGGRLQWGLSAAGYLDPDIFTFFQHCGIEIMSGFGMTEATGGITMTPPFKYRTNSVGIALPGIDIKLDADGEMMIKGPYVMLGYLDEKDTGLSDGWFRTGDIFKQDRKGYFQIIDRKKEIYKNTGGETISPQKIENMFHDFDSIKRVFVVGDHREYNTLLIYPNHDYEALDFSTQTEKEQRTFFSSLIVSVNQFLTPYERITNFRVIERDFSVDQGELTPKGTFKRRAIEKNFAATIAQMYERNYLSIAMDDFEIRLPTWFLRARSLTEADVQVRDDCLKLANLPAQLTIRFVRKRRPRHVQIGSLTYATRQDHIDLGEIIHRPSLCIGNVELSEFAGASLFEKRLAPRQNEPDIELALPAKSEAVRFEYLPLFEQSMKSRTLDMQGIYLAAYILYIAYEPKIPQAVDYLRDILQTRNELTYDAAKVVLMRTAAVTNIELKRKAFRILMSCEQRNALEPVMDRFLLSKHRVLNNETITRLSEHHFTDEQLDSVLNYLIKCFDEVHVNPGRSSRYPIAGLLKLLTEYGIHHPLSYKAIRAGLVKWELLPPNKSIKKQAQTSLAKLTEGFRAWLGENQQVAIDYEQHREFQWRDVLTFEERIPLAEREHLTEAIRTQPLIREAIFIFSGGRLIQLSSIAVKGIWVSFIGSRHGKSVYRVAIQTHNYGSFDIAVNLSKSMKPEQIAGEINWLIGAGASGQLRPLVEDFGGYWPEFGLWTEEFIPGQTVEKLMRRLDSQSPLESERLINLWTSFVWNGLSAYVDFWTRTGYRMEIANPSPANVVVPAHDYQVGCRIVSISSRHPFNSVTNMILNFRENFVDIMESRYEQLKGRCSWSVLFSAFLEILGEVEGLALLEKERLKSASNKRHAAMLLELENFIRNIKQNGYKPERLYFAIERFKRWLKLNPDATPQACIQTLIDLTNTYILKKVEERYPGARIQFYRDTVFLKSEKPLRNTLNRIRQRQKEQGLTFSELHDQFAELQNTFDLSEAEQVFLTRLCYPHLGALESAQMISVPTEGGERAALVVFTTDDQGNQLAIRNAVSPKEIARLHSLFTRANLPVEFRPEHKFLVILNTRARVMGGLFYRHTSEAQIHLEKVVVDDIYRRRKVSDSLMTEFFNRIRSEGIEIVTVGFLRPEYFYRFGFRIDHRFGNMVKRLAEETKTEGKLELVEQAGQPATWEL